MRQNIPNPTVQERSEVPKKQAQGLRTQQEIRKESSAAGPKAAVRISVLSARLHWPGCSHFWTLTQFTQRVRLILRPGLCPPEILWSCQEAILPHKAAERY